MSQSLQDGNPLEIVPTPPYDPKLDRTEEPPFKPANPPKTFPPKFWSLWRTSSPLMVPVGPLEYDVWP